MNRKIVLLSGALVIGGVIATLAAPHTTAAKANPTVNSQSEFDKVFATVTDPQTLNAAGHAYDNQNSRLYWFTDLEAAKREAKAEGKPILSLRLLGNLSDEYSCANSRFFRVLLYANQQINPILRDKFILHWSSERPVPVVTIDFGDGRKLKQTITGNSAHYLLDEDGRPLDVLPGLYSPKAFQTWLERAQKLEADWKAEPAASRDQMLEKWHEERIPEIWKEQAGINRSPQFIAQQVQYSFQMSPLLVAKPKFVPALTPARTAATLAVTKMLGEAPMLNATNLFSTSARLDSGATWIWGDPTANKVTLDKETVARIKAMNPVVTPSNPKAAKPPIQAVVSFAQFEPNTVPFQKPNTFENMIQLLEFSVAIDTAANTFRMEIPIHTLFAKGKEGDFTTLNRTIYDRLFLTPKSDPYLGLSSQGTFTGLQNGGIVRQSGAE